MPIEFRCHQCGKLLRVGDETAGKQAKCPSCGSVQAIPAASPAPEMRGPPPLARPASNPFGAPPNAGLGGSPDFQSDNPYASPPSPMLPPSGPFYDHDRFSGPRSGPPWERDGASISSYFATFKETFSSPNFMFSDMRREGGLGAPLLYGMAGGVAWGVIGLVFQLGVQGLLNGAAGGLGGPGAGPPGFAPGIFLGVGLAAGVILLPLATLIVMFLSAGVFHLMLMMLGAARQPFETTFRVVAYSHGTSSVFAAVPFCGQYAQWLAELIFVGIGLCRAHEISGGKATLAVLLPVIVCCGGMIALYAVVIGAIIAGAR